MRSRRANHWSGLSVILVGIFVAPVTAENAPTLDSRRQALATEQLRCETLLRQDRTNAAARAAYVRVLRQQHLARRHGDPSYAAVVQQMAPSQALDVYQQVLRIVPSVYVDQVRASVTDLFASGVQELLYATEDDTFLRTYLTSSIQAADTFKEFRVRLTKLRDQRPGPATPSQARDLVLGLGQMAQDLDLPVTKGFLVALTLEMACGACNALDEYTLFLTPGHVANEALGIEMPVGIGIEVALLGDTVVVERVYPNGPAAGKVAVQDRILSINNTPVTGLPLEDVLALLRGEANSPVLLEVLPAGQVMALQPFAVARQAVAVPTVEQRILDTPELAMLPGMMPAERIGYLRILSFQHSTVQEVREALLRLQMDGARGIVLDLRGNGGGVFQSAVSIAELFLTEGQVVVRGVGPVPQFNKPFPAGGGNPLTLPLAVLIDGDTASAAEVLVGALKDQNRARLFGQTTFGKGLIQCIIPVTKPGPAGRIATALKISVARFFTPGKEPVHLRGIAPHDVLDPQGELPINTARLYLLGVLRAGNIR